MSEIVVGVDGSEESQEALRWAVEEARLRGATVEAVYAYEYTPEWRAYRLGEGATVDPSVLRDQMEREADQAREHAEGVLASLVRTLGDVEDVPIRRVAVQNPRPARALIERAGNADLLVVGSRGLGGFRGLLLGSVSQQTAHHAPCPLVIVGPRR